LKRRWKVLVLVCILLSTRVRPLAADQEITVVNGDVEDAARPLNGWTVTGTTGTADVQVSSGFWRKCTVSFNSGRHTKANINLGAYAMPTGRCWIDNLRPSGFVIQNPSFEELTPDGKQCVGWSMDGPGRLAYVDCTRASEGKVSVMMFDVSGAASMIRLNQTVDIKPNTDYSYTFDFYMENDFYGGIRCSALGADTREYAYLGGMVEDLDEVIADRSLAGSRQARLRPDGGPISISQHVAVPMGAVLEASCVVKCKQLKGEVTLDALDPNNGRTLASVKGDPAREDWDALRIRFVAPSPAVVIRATGRGKGVVLVDNVRLSNPLLLPQPQHITWRKASDGLPLSGSLTFSISGSHGGLLKTGLEMLRKDLAPLGITLEDSGAGQRKLRIVIDTKKTPNAPADRGEESYYLDVDRKGVTIEAGTEQGAFYGLMTLLQLLSRDNDGKPLIAGCTMLDWPDFPWRSLFGAQGPEWMARRKFNRVECLTPVQCLSYRRYGIIGIPHDNIIHYPYGEPSFPEVLKNPNFAGGAERKDKIVLTGGRPAELSRAVLRTKLTDITVTSEDGKTVYAKGRDYIVIAGELQIGGGAEPMRITLLKPFALARTSDSAIPSGATVVATYEEAAGYLYEAGGSLCLAELEPQRSIAQRAKEDVARYGLPFHGFHVSESAGVGQGPRCRATGLTPCQLLARYYEMLDKAIKEANPKCRILAFTDDYMPWQNAGRSGLAEMARFMPKDAIMSTWYYGPGGTVEFNMKTARLWNGLGHDFTLMGWYDPYNIRATAAVAFWARRQGMSCLGTSNWAYPIGMKAGGSLEFLDEVARCAWRGPHRGEPGYVDVDSELIKQKGQR
jgi:hypothetical protein